MCGCELVWAGSWGGRLEDIICCTLEGSLVKEIWLSLVVMEVVARFVVEC